MEFFVPSILLMLFALAVIMMVIPKLPNVVILGFAVVAVLLALENHFAMFTSEYRMSSWMDSFNDGGMYLMTGLLVVFLLGYVIYLFGQRRTPNLPMPPANIPPPSTATNFMTRAIGTGLVATGMTNVSKNAQSTNNSRTRGVNSVLSAGV